VTPEPAEVASIQMPHLPALNSVRFSVKPFEEAPGGPALSSDRHSTTASSPLGAVERRLPLLVEQRAPNELAAAVRKAHVLAPAGLAAKANAIGPVFGSVIFLAASAIKSQVGKSGIFRPAFSSKSLRYMVKELSP